MNKIITNSAKKSNKYFTLKTIEQILTTYDVIWYHKLSKNELNKYYTIDDFKKYFLENDHLLFDDINEFNSYKIIGVYQLNKILQTKTAGYTNSKFYLFIILSNLDGQCYLSISKTSPCLWYSVTTKSELKTLFESLDNYYNCNSYDIKYNKRNKVFVGTRESLNCDFIELENSIIANNFSEILTWGSAWNDYPFRDILLNDLSKYDRNSLSVQAMRQVDNNNQINVKTLLSKSHLTFYDVNGIYLLDYYYNPIFNKQIDVFNKKINKNIPNDVPIDLLMVLINYYHDDIYDLLSVSEPPSINYYISAMLIESNDDIDKLKSFFKNNKSEVINTFISDLETNKQIKDTFDNSFENFVVRIFNEMKNETQNINDIKSSIVNEVKKKLTQLDFTNKYVNERIGSLIDITIDQLDE